MDEVRRKRLEARARIAKALSHPLRLFLLEELRDRELSVQELSAEAASEISTISRHLSVLQNAGLVVPERRGRKVFYQLRCGCLEGFFTCFEEVLQDHVQRQAALVEN